MFLLIILTLALCSPLTVFAQNEENGCSPDSFFPESGNCGYEVEHYQIDFDWDQPANILKGDVTLTINLLTDLSEISLDFSNHYIVTEVFADDLPVSFEHEADNLNIPGPFSSGETIDVRVIYSGLVEETMAFSTVSSPFKGANDPFCIISEPNLAQSWFPGNDTPRDRAVFDIKVTVPAKYAVGSNGTLNEIAFSDGTVLSPEDNFEMRTDKEAEGTVTYSYRAEDPMPPYLMTVCVGEFEISGRNTDEGGYQLDFIEQEIPARDQFQKWADLMPEMIACFEPYLGAYPFDESGSIVIDRSIGGALETQTRSVYGSDMLLAGEDGFSHELSHQWIGDLVSLNDWSDLWIKEGFATFAEALWLKCSKGENAFRENITSNYQTIALMTIKNRKVSVMAERYGSAEGMADFRFEQAADAVSMLSLLCDRDFSEDDLDFIQTGVPVTGGDFWTKLPKYCSLLSIDPLKQKQVNRFFGLDDDFDIKLTGPKSITNDLRDMYSLLPYQGGSLVYAALYFELGEVVFTQAMRDLIETYRWNTVTTDQVIEIFSKAAGRDLNELIQSWLLYRIPPDIPGLITYQETLGTQK